MSSEIYFIILLLIVSFSFMFITKRIKLKNNTEKTELKDFGSETSMIPKDQFITSIVSIEDLNCKKVMWLPFDTDQTSILAADIKTIQRYLQQRYDSKLFIHTLYILKAFKKQEYMLYGNVKLRSSKDLEQVCFGTLTPVVED